MQESNYIVLIDENGQPYIAHSVWDKAKAFGGKVASGAKSFGRSARSAGARAHKYILKVGEGAKAQYAYTKEEADRLLGRGRKAVGEAVEKGKSTVKSAAKSGREALSTAGTKARDVLGYSARDAFRTANEGLTSAINASQQATSERKDAENQYRKASTAAAWAKVDKVDLDYDPFKKYIAPLFSSRVKEQNESVEKRVEETEAARIKEARDLGRMTLLEVTRAAEEQEAWKTYNAALTAYGETPLGKIDSFIASAKYFADDVKERVRDLDVKELASEAADKAKETIGLDARARLEDAEIASGAAKTNRRLAHDRWQKAVEALDEARAASEENPRDKSLKEKYDKARDELYEASLDLDRTTAEADRAEREASHAKASYTSTPLGKIAWLINH